MTPVGCEPVPPGRLIGVASHELVEGLKASTVPDPFMATQSRPVASATSPAGFDSDAGKANVSLTAFVLGMIRAILPLVPVCSVNQTNPPNSGSPAIPPTPAVGVGRA